MLSAVPSGCVPDSEIHASSLSSLGLALATAANVWWGLSPLFWKQLGQFEPFTLVAHRVVWSFALLAIIQTITGGWGKLFTVVRQPKNLLFTVVTATMLFGNWLIFIIAVNSDRVTEAALGYFLLPLLSVFLARVIFRERLRTVQWICIAVVSAGVILLTIDVGQVPWLSLSLGVSFAIYGAVRKQVEYGALDGLTLEVSILVTPMAAYLIWTQLGDEPTVLLSQPGTNLLLLATAVITAFPLVTFARAVRLVPLSIAGLFQYLNPTLQFLVGVWVYNEAFEGGQVVRYMIIWAGLLIFAVESAMVGGRQKLRTA